MTEATFHLTVPSLRVALAAVVLAMTGCSGMMNTPTASSSAGLSPSGRVTITEDFVTGVGAGNGTLEHQGAELSVQSLRQRRGPRWRG